MSDKSVVVFTGESIERILREGGTSSWHLDRNHARQCIFVICTQNARAKGDWADGTEDHGSAFLIGKVRNVVPSPSNEVRYQIQFSEYARVNIPNVWQGYQNPVKYVTLEELGIDPSTLKWEPVPEPVSSPDPIPQAIPYTAAAPLTMAEAKKGLALTFGVSPEAIEITIRG